MLGDWLDVTRSVADLGPQPVLLLGQGPLQDTTQVSSFLQNSSKNVQDGGPLLPSGSHSGMMCPPLNSGPSAKLI